MYPTLTLVFFASLAHEISPKEEDPPSVGVTALYLFPSDFAHLS